MIDIHHEFISKQQIKDLEGKLHFLQFKNKHLEEKNNVLESDNKVLRTRVLFLNSYINALDSNNKLVKPTKKVFIPVGANITANKSKWACSCCGVIKAKRLFTRVKDKKGSYLINNNCLKHILDNFKVELWKIE